MAKLDKNCELMDIQMSMETRPEVDSFIFERFYLLTGIYIVHYNQPPPPTPLRIIKSDAQHS